MGMCIKNYYFFQSIQNEGINHFMDCMYVYMNIGFKICEINRFRLMLRGKVPYVWICRAAFLGILLEEKKNRKEKMIEEII